MVESLYVKNKSQTKVKHQQLKSNFFFQYEK